jgi:hypothetical protein
VSENGVRKDRSWCGEIYQGDKKPAHHAFKYRKFVASRYRPA